MDQSIGFMVDMNSEGVTITPKQEHKYTLIWLPGLGQDSTKFFNLFLTKPLVSSLTNFKIRILQPPMRPVTVMKGANSFAWFDLYHRDADTFTRPTSESFDMNTIEESTRLIHACVEQESSLGKRVFLGGFSQGCAMALYAGYALKQDVTIIAVAGYMFQETAYRESIPAIIFHGTKDRTRPWENIEVSYKQKSCPVRMIEGMGHKLKNPQLRQEICDFINEQIN